MDKRNYQSKKNDRKNPPSDDKRKEEKEEEDPDMEDYVFVYNGEKSLNAQSHYGKSVGSSSKGPGGKNIAAGPEKKKEVAKTETLSSSNATVARMHPYCSNDRVGPSHLEKNVRVSSGDLGRKNSPAGVEKKKGVAKTEAASCPHTIAETHPHCSNDGAGFSHFGLSSGNPGRKNVPPAKVQKKKEVASRLLTKDSTITEISPHSSNDSPTSSHHGKNFGSSPGDPGRKEVAAQKKKKKEVAKTATPSSESEDSAMIQPYSSNVSTPFGNTFELWPDHAGTKKISAEMEEWKRLANEDPVAFSKAMANSLANLHLGDLEDLSYYPTVSLDKFDPGETIMAAEEKKKKEVEKKKEVVKTKATSSVVQPYSGNNDAFSFPHDIDSEWPGDLKRKNVAAEVEKKKEVASFLKAVGSTTPRTRLYEAEKKKEVVKAEAASSLKAVGSTTPRTQLHGAEKKKEVVKAEAASSLKAVGSTTPRTQLHGAVSSNAKKSTVPRAQSYSEWAKFQSDLAIKKLENIPMKRTEEQEKKIASCSSNEVGTGSSGDEDVALPMKKTKKQIANEKWWKEHIKKRPHYITIHPDDYVKWYVPESQINVFKTDLIDRHYFGEDPNETPSSEDED